MGEYIKYWRKNHLHDNLTTYAIKKIGGGLAKHVLGVVVFDVMEGIYGQNVKIFWQSKNFLKLFISFQLFSPKFDCTGKQNYF